MRNHGKGAGSVVSLETELASVKSLLPETEDAISDMRGLQAASISGIALGILTGPFAPIVSGASIYGTVDTTEQIDALNKAREQQKQDVLRLTREIASLKSELAFCGAHVDSLGGIVAKCTGAILGLDREAQAWALLGQSLTATSQGLKRAEIESFWLVEDLDAANSMWTGTVDFATAMRRNQAAPVQRQIITA